MSQSIDVYCKSLSADLVPKMVKRLNDFDMVVEVHPDFSFNQQEDSGFLPFKFRFKDTHFNILKDKNFKSGFEIYIHDFDLEKTKVDLQPKQSLFDKLLGRQKTVVEYARPEIEKRLIDCTKVVSFVWNSGDSFEFRFAFLASAILTELTNGVCNDPANDIWYDNNYIVEQAYRESSAFEQTIKETELRFHEFDGW
jgi:hypothetical protein